MNNNLETFIIIDNFKIQGLIINNQYINEIPEAYFLTEFTPFLECLKNTLDNQNFFIVQNDVHDYLGCIKLSTIIKHIATVTTHNPNAHVCLIGTNNHRNNSNELLRIFAKENIEVQHFQVLQSNSSSAIYPNYFIYCQIANVDEDHFFILLKKYNFILNITKNRRLSSLIPRSLLII